ncbi:MAG TPA: methylmalonyl-CoA decarboxylase [Candidatus Kapabacteria bacterium]|nr:methylmalonyl-CoA decarboxylase [Candidatus Kapabacteria bacterium]HPO61695.1 methylmalonyl-CoA decarboxylase [Candidatus Kapabacteria bacterium]
MGLILKEFKDKIGTITFNNDEKRNCLSKQLLLEFIDALEELKREKARVVIIRAKRGARVWSSGFDINDLPDPGRDPLSYNDPLEVTLRAVQDFPAPVIAMIEGSVWGGACDLAFCCDILIGTHTASFAITPAKIGVPYNPSGIMHFISMAGTHLAKEMFFTALPINALQAKHHGILNHYVPNIEELEEFTMFTANLIKQNSPLSIAVIKEQLRILSSSQALSPETFERIQGLRRKVYDSNDYVEGIKAFKEKRKPNFDD